MDKNVFFRLREERERLGITQASMAEVTGVNIKTVGRWEREIPIPSDKLAVLVDLGIDVLYVLTGQNNVMPRIGDIAKQFHIGGLVSTKQNQEPKLSARELAMLERFRLASEQDKKAIERVADLAAHAANTPAANGD